MNGSAVITTARKENVLLVPIEATQEDSAGVYVYIRSADDQSYERVDVTLGLSDGTNAEVTGGLSAGDTIWYADTSALQLAVSNMGMNARFSEAQSGDYSGGE